MNLSDKYSWEGVFASIKKGTYATDYAIGDTVPLDLGSEGVINMQIAAFDTDDLADGSGKAPITWISMDVYSMGLANPALVTNKDENGGTIYVEGTGSIGGWEKSEIRSTLKNNIKPLIPDNVRNAIREVTKTHNAKNTHNESFEQTTIDDIWVPSYAEVNGIAYSSLFSVKEKRIKYGVNSMGGYVNTAWLLRDEYGNNYFRVVQFDGSFSSIACGYECNCALCFCT